MEIRLNSQKYLTKINKKEAIKNLFDFNFGSAVTEIVDIQMDIEMKAFCLLFNSFRETNLQLSKAYGQEQINREYKLTSFATNVDSDYRNFLEQEVVITKDFFSNVLTENSNYLVASFNIFAKFCEELNISLPPDIRTSYYINFRENLQTEFQNNYERYHELQEVFNNPVTLQNDRLAKLLHSYSLLKLHYTQPLQQDPSKIETLKDLYINPNFSVHKNNVRKVDEKENPKFYSISGININEYFNNYFFNSKQHSAIKENYDMVFVLGQPGQGKTSFCYKLLYDYIENNNDIPSVPIVFQKIRDLVAKDFINNPFETVNKYNPILNFDEDEFVLVLDGLDEAYMSGGISDNDLRNLYERLKKRSNKKIKIILTSRFNFLSIDDSCLDNTLVLQLDELTDEQIKEYCTRFKVFYPKNCLANKIDTIIDSKKFDHIRELLRQAVLIYFIGISDIEIEDRDSKAKIYDKIFDSLAQRSWDANGQLDYINPTLKANPDRYKQYLREYIRSIAFKIFHSPNLYITLNELLEMESTKTFIRRCFSSDIANSEEKIKELSKYLLISFYFQQSKKENADATLEFFHNSLWEFLTAEYIWEEFKKLALQKDEYDDYKVVNRLQYFEFLNLATGNKNLNDYSIPKNLNEIIASEDDQIKEDIFHQTVNPFLELSNYNYLLFYHFEKCKQKPFVKSHEIFLLAWILLHESNDGREKIDINNAVLDFLFDKVELKYNKVIDHISLDDNILCVDRRRLFYIIIKNSYFKNTFNYHIYHSVFSYVIFESMHKSEKNIEQSEFKKVIFKNCYFYEGFAFFDNTFSDVEFREVLIPNENWYEKFLQENRFDENFQKFHSIEARIQKDENQEEKNRYFIVYNMPQEE